MKILKKEERLRAFCRRIATAFLVMASLWGGPFLPHGAEAYVMPSEQLLGFVAAHFKNFKTISILQSTRLAASQENEPAIAFEERVWVEPPASYRSQIVTEIEEEDMSLEEIQSSRFEIDPGYRQLFAANGRQDLSNRLAAWGIDLSKVSLTLIDETVAYAIGDYKDKTMPALLIEKKRFLPILLRYRVFDKPGIEPVTIRFHDFRKIKEGWYPFRIDCFSGQELIERYFALETKFNVPFPAELFRGEEMKPDSKYGEPSSMSGQ